MHRSGDARRRRCRRARRDPVHLVRAHALRLHHALSEYQLGRALDDGLRRGVASLRRLRVCAERLESGPGGTCRSFGPCSRSRGIGFDPGGSRSELHAARRVSRALGLPLPVQQYRVKIGAKTFRPDFAWPDCKVFAEYYGLPFHTGASAVVADSERLTALSAAGGCRSSSRMRRPIARSSSAPSPLCDQRGSRGRDQPCSCSESRQLLARLCAMRRFLANCW